MGYRPTDEDISRIQELIASSTLTSIEVHELSARRHESPDEALEADKADAQISIQHRLDGESFGIRMVCEVKLRVGEVRVMTSGEYALTGGFVPTQRDIQLFGNEVAVMTVFPYLRENVSDITSRVFGNPLLLPIAERGQLAFEVEELAVAEG